MGAKVEPHAQRVVLRAERSLSALPLLRVIISGVASRHDLLVDQLDDIQLAIETLLVEEPEGIGELVLEVWHSGAEMRLCLHGLHNHDVKSALIADEPFMPCEGCLIDVRVLLLSLVDDFSVEEGSDGTFAVLMGKRA